MWWAWGVSGALVYQVNAFIFAMWNAGANRATRYKALAELAAALFTGAVLAQGWTSSVRQVIARWVEADGVAVALTIGWAANYIAPKLLRKLGERVDRSDLLSLKGPNE